MATEVEGTNKHSHVMSPHFAMNTLHKVSHNHRPNTLLVFNFTKKGSAYYLYFFECLEQYIRFSFRLSFGGDAVNTKASLQRQQ